MIADVHVPGPVPGGWTADSPSALRKLASDLANNYLDTSLSLEDGTKPSLRARVFKDAPLSTERDDAGNLWRPSRTILVLGSGASAAAFGEDKFPLVSQAIDRVQKVLAIDGASPEFIERRLNEESRRVAMFYGFQRARTDFETQLGILSGIFSPAKVADALSGEYSMKYAPHMIFELIAHMLKHRFIDAVINFNFDELLDIAITEEIGESHFHNVFSDGHCKPLSEIMVGDRLKIPLYIKPHGTVSHKSTMRFTKDQYYGLPGAMYTFMRDVVAGHHKEETERGGGGYRAYHTNIISVGFGMGSLDLLGMIRNAAVEEKHSFAMFYLNKGKWGEDGKADQLRRETGVECQYLVDVDELGGIEGALRELWRTASAPFSELYQPRGIARHEVIHHIFHRPSAPGRPGSRVPDGPDATYFRARLCTEVVLALATGNGRFDLSQAIGDRVGTYFDHLSRPSRSPAFSMLDVVHDLGEDYLSWTGSAQDILTVRDTHRGGSAAEAREKLATSLWKRLSECLRRLGDPDLEARIGEIEAWGSDDRRHPVHCLRKLVDSDAQDIKPRFSHSHFLLFRQPNVDQVLHTNLSVTINFVKMITEVEWDLMLTVSENGKIFEKFKAHRDANPDNPNLGGDKYFSIVVAETDHKEITYHRIADSRLHLLGGSNGMPFYSLPVTQHNHHMTLLLRHDPAARGGWVPVRAIYYEKVGMGNRVSPVLLDHAQDKDLDVLLTTFFAYVAKAEAAGRNGGAARDRPGPEKGDATVPASEWLLKAAQGRREELLEEWSGLLARRAGP